MRILAASALAILLIIASQSGSSPALSVVNGVIDDGSGGRLPAVVVELLADRVVRHTALTNALGEFRVEGVAAGRYELRVRRSGFRTLTQALTVDRDPPPPLHLSMILIDAAAAGQEYAPSTKFASHEAPLRSPWAMMNGVAGARATAPPAPALLAPQFVAGALPLPFNTEAYDRLDENGFRRAADDSLSTFSIDVDTASYSNVRRFLSSGTLPPADAVRVEEMVNYFRFQYAPTRSAEPFSVTTEIALCPWNARNRLALIGLQARPLDAGKTPPRNLVFLIDVSGSMNEPDKLPLVQTALRMLADTLTAADRVAIVVYAGASGMVLPPTRGDGRAAITQAIAGLSAGGSTNGAEGIRLAYDTAAVSFIKGGINRVILATDGDFNVGLTSEGELTRLIEAQRARGIFLSGSRRRHR